MTIADTIRIIRGHLTPVEIEERDAQARQRVQAHAQAQERDVAAGQEYRRYQDRMHKAAGIATVTLHCHFDTWMFIDRNASCRISWRSPELSEITSAPGGMRHVTLSGPQLVTILFVMADLIRINPGVRMVPIGVHPIARRVYDAVATVVDLADPQAPRVHQLPPIVIDDRPARRADGG